MMTIHLFQPAEAGLPDSGSPSPAATVIRPKRIWRQICLAALSLWLGLALLILSVVVVARSTVFLPLVDLPQATMPGNLLPNDVSCHIVGNIASFCEANHAAGLSDQAIYYIVDSTSRRIQRTVIPTRAYTLGQLAASWGTPTGITQSEHNTYIYWGTRSAWLATTSLKLDSLIDYVLFDLEPPKASPWHGFTKVKR